MPAAAQCARDRAYINRIGRAARHYLDNVVQPNHQENRVCFMKIAQAMGQRTDFITKLWRIRLGQYHSVTSNVEKLALFNQRLLKLALFFAKRMAEELVEDIQIYAPRRLHQPSETSRIPKGRCAVGQAAGVLVNAKR